MSTRTPAAAREISQLLSRLRQNQTEAKDSQHNDRVFAFVSSGDTSHLVCDKAEPTVVESTKYLLKLVDFKGESAKKWRLILSKCLESCIACGCRFGWLKECSKLDYMGGYPDAAVNNFFHSLQSWENSVALGSLKAISSSASSEIPSSLLCFVLNNLQLAQDSRIVSIIRSKPPPDKPLLDWPLTPPPPGVFLLMFDDTPDLRKWACTQAEQSTQKPLPHERLGDDHKLAIATVFKKFGSPEPNSSVHNAAYLWESLSLLLRLLPDELLSTGSHGFDFRRMITGHLHDAGDEILPIVICFTTLLARLDERTWTGEEQDFPQVVLDSIKDNPTLLKRLEIAGKTEDKAGALRWIRPLVLSVWNMNSFGDILAKAIGFLCGELQHDRLMNFRPVAMTTAIQLVSAIIRRCPHNQTAQTQEAAISHVLDIHAGIFTAVAFGKAYNGPTWSAVRTPARELVLLALEHDIDNMIAALMRLNAQLVCKEYTLHIPSVCPQLWKSFQSSLRTSSSTDITLAINLFGKFAHIDRLHEKACKLSKSVEEAIGREAMKAMEHSMKSAVRQLNEQMQIIVDAVSKTLSRICDENIAADVLLEALSGAVATKCVIKLAISPREQIQSAALGFIGEAVDADDRTDRFRVLLVNSPDAAFEGLCELLQVSSTYAAMVPEACSLSKTLVQCFTDIIDILCATPRGLLHNPAFTRPNDPDGLRPRLLNLWEHMTGAITVIFKRTAAWSAYFDTEAMIIWMRDALIFGRDLLAQREIIESAAAKDRTEQSEVRQKMLRDLQPVLLELTRWLRLTDPELLHQSFSLLQSLLACFLQTKTRPSEVSMTKLWQHITNSRKPGIAKTKLDSNRILELEDSLTAFDAPEEQAIEISDDDEGLDSDASTTSSGVEIVDNYRSSAKPPKVKAEKPAKRDKDVKSNKTQASNLSPWVKDKKPKGNERHEPPAKAKEKRAKADLTFTPAERERLEDTSTSIQGFRAKARRSASTEARPMPAGPGRTPSAPPSKADSDSSSSEDGEDGIEQLAAMQKAKPVKKQRRQMKVIEDPRLTKDPRMERERAEREEARRKFARRNPDLSALHKVILSWNYGHYGSDPPNFDPKKIRRIPDRFQDYTQYRSVFEPLLLLECWSQIIDSKQQSPEVVEFKLTGSRNIDDWIDIDATPAEGVVVPRDWYLSEVDVVLLKQIDGDKCIMAKVQAYQSSLFQTMAQFRCYIPPASVNPGLQVNTVWKVSRVFSLSTVHREYAALMVMSAVDCESTVYGSRLPPRKPPSDVDIHRTMEAYQVNEPQARAICSSMQSDGFTLIQGPPGTGKTSTICALVETFMSRRQKAATTVNVGRNSTAADKQPVQKVLICAPSNAAIDEVASRVRDGPRGRRRTTPVNVVRVGAEQSINVSVKDISLDHLVEQKMNQDHSQQTQAQDDRQEEASLRTELDAIKKDKDRKHQELAAARDSNSARSSVLQDDIRALNAKRINVTQQLDRLRDKRKSNKRSQDGLRRAVRAEILAQADVICSTLSGAGHDLLDVLDFELTIIDEAAQAVELSSLIPMRFNTKRCIMVGDPQQLPPTVLSDTAKRYLYDQSLFVRFHKSNPHAAHLLSIQYRMHPSISSCPSRLFYQGALEDGPGMPEKTLKDWHRNPKFGPYKFFNIVSGREESGHTRSLRNRAECQAVLALYQRLRQEYVSYEFDFKIGIVSMYKAQVQELKRVFSAKYGQEILGRVDFHTVDGFQGQEKEIIILTCVRAGPGVQSIGFLSDVRRINVAMTRAQSSLFILGNVATLERSDPTWKAIITDAKARDVCIEADTSYFTSSGTTRVAMPKPPSQSSSGSKRPAPVEPPRDLMTPQQLKAAGAQVRAPPASHSSAPMDVDMPPPQTTNNKYGASSSPGSSRNGTAPLPLSNKRKAEETSNQGGGKGSEPRPPPPKKKKQASMFIPKKR